MSSAAGSPTNLEKDRRGIAAVGAVALALGFVILRSRNLYEDEWVSLATIRKPLAELWRWSLTIDIHPPGSYALDHFLLQWIGSPRGIGAIHLLAWTAGALFFVLAARHLLERVWGRVVFAGLALMHPHVLMWNTSIRWYPVWWGLALTIVAFGLLPRHRNAPDWFGCLGLGAAIGALVHLDYLGLLFAPAFGIAWMARFGVGSRVLLRLVALALAAAIVASPLLKPLIMIMGHGGPGHMLSPVMSAARLLYVFTVGDALLPWNPISLLVVVGLLLPAGYLLVRGGPAYVRMLKATEPSAARELAGLATFTALMLAGGVVSGAGSHSYALLGMMPLVALLIALGIERVDQPRWRLAVIAVVGVWIAMASYDLIARTGTAKRQFNDHPEVIIAELEHAVRGEPAVVLTDDVVLTFEINERRAKRATSLVTCSCIADDYHGRPAGLAGDIGRYPWVIVLEHSEAEWDEVGMLAKVGFDRAHGMIPDAQMIELAPDPDFRLKNLIPGPRLERSRLRAWYGHPAQGDWSAVEAQMMKAASRCILGVGR